MANMAGIVSDFVKGLQLTMRAQDFNSPRLIIYAFNDKKTN